MGTFSLTGGMLATTGANTITVDSSVLVDDVGAPGYIVYVAVTDGTNGSAVVSEAGVVTATPMFTAGPTATASSRYVPSNRPDLYGRKYRRGLIRRATEQFWPTAKLCPNNGSNLYEW